MAGRDADTLVIPVPVGTLVTDVETGAIIADLDHVDMQFLLCHGGRGGYGNAHFATSTRQSPNFAELGDIGEERKVKLELKLVADIGIIGMPNAGKSTFIASVTNVRPKIADYPFTTLIPNLGVMDHKGKSLILEDVPGLIVGASEGKGLGIEFLKHIERTHVLLHLLDMFEGDAIIERYRDIRKELKKFSSDLAKKQEIIVLTKLDVVGEEEAKRLLKLFKSKVRGKKIFIVSSAARMGLEELQNALINLDPTEISEELPDEDQEEFHTYDLKESNDANYIKLEKIDGVHFRVSGPRIEQIVRMTSMQNIE
jgi:GTP-binding protein